MPTPKERHVHEGWVFCVTTNMVVNRCIKYKTDLTPKTTLDSKSVNQQLWVVRQNIVDPDKT